MFELTDKQRIIKNLLAMNIGMLLVFGAANSTAAIQPVLNQEGNLGLISQSVNFAASLVTALVIPAIFVEFFGWKWAMVIGELTFLSYIVIQAYPVASTLIPSNYLQ